MTYGPEEAEADRQERAAEERAWWLPGQTVVIDRSSGEQGLFLEEPWRVFPVGSARTVIKAQFPVAGTVLLHPDQVTWYTPGGDWVIVSTATDWNGEAYPYDEPRGDWCDRCEGHFWTTDEGHTACRCGIWCDLVWRDPDALQRLLQGTGADTAPTDTPPTEQEEGSTVHSGPYDNHPQVDGHASPQYAVLSSAGKPEYFVYPSDDQTEWVASPAIGGTSYYAAELRDRSDAELWSRASTSWFPDRDAAFEYALYQVNRTQS